MREAAAGETRNTTAPPNGASPLLSIITPSHGRAAQVDALMAALAAQRARLSQGAALVEIILVDDGSAPPLALRPSLGVELIRLQAQRGAPAARRAGFRAARGAFVHFHDSDDFIPPEWLERLVAALSAAAPPDLLITARLVRTGGAREPALVVPRFAQRAAGAPQRLRHYLRFENAIGPLGGVTFSQRAAQRLSFAPLRSCQDWHMYWEALGGPCRVVVDAETRFIFNTGGEDRLSRSYRRKALGMLGFARLTAQGAAQRRMMRRYFLGQARARHRAGAAWPLRLHARIARAAALMLARRPRLCALVFERSARANSASDREARHASIPSARAERRRVG
ncbi:MAG: glycosyltransferase family 2 protein [Pseudomonadota bacterium]